MEDEVDTAAEATPKAKAPKAEAKTGSNAKPKPLPGPPAEKPKAEDEGVTAAEMLNAVITMLRKEHLALGGGNNTAHSKAITFASTARDLVSQV